MTCRRRRRRGRAGARPLHPRLLPHRQHRVCGAVAGRAEGQQGVRPGPWKGSRRRGARRELVHPPHFDRRRGPVRGSRLDGLEDSRIGHEAANADPTIRNWWELRSGDCLNNPGLRGGRGPMRDVSCGRRHDAEVYFVFPVRGQQFPGQREIYRQSERRPAPDRHGGPRPGLRGGGRSGPLTRRFARTPTTDLVWWIAVIR
jgi:hypothetical protein